MSYTKNTRSQDAYMREVTWLIELSKLNTPHVIKLLQYNHDDMTVTTAKMPYTLEDLIIDKKLSVYNKKKIIQQLTDFLCVIKDLGIAHGDFKAKNIVVENDLETVHVIDFEHTHYGHIKTDLKKFKFLILQLCLNIDYTTSWTQYHKLKKQVTNPTIIALLKLFDDKNTTPDKIKNLIHNCA